MNRRCLFGLLWTFAVGCSQQADPCGSYSGTCLAVEVQSASTETVSLLLVSVQRGVEKPVERRSEPPGGATGFPLLFPVLLGSFSGTVQVGVEAPALSLRGRGAQVLAEGEHGRLTITLTGDGAPDMSGGGNMDMAESDLQPGPTTPGGRSAAAMAYYPDRGSIVMFGGVGERSSPLGDTWEWKDGAWRELKVLESPSPRSGASIAYDPNRKALVLFGGLAAGVGQQDLWTFDSRGAWQKAAPIGQPPARAGAAMSYAPVLGQVTLAGGVQVEGDVTLTDLWTLGVNNLSWTRQAIGMPAKLRGHHLVTNGQVTFLEGADQVAGTVQLWTLTILPGWSAVAARGQLPSARKDMAVVYDASVSGIVAYGGVTLDDTKTFEDVFIYQPSSNLWVEAAILGTAPALRLRGQMAYDAAASVAVLFGGRAAGIVGGRTVFADTWGLRQAKDWLLLAK